MRIISLLNSTNVDSFQGDVGLFYNDGLRYTGDLGGTVLEELAAVGVVDVCGGHAVSGDLGEAAERVALVLTAYQHFRFYIITHLMRHWNKNDNTFIREKCPKRIIIRNDTSIVSLAKSAQKGFIVWIFRL